MAATIFVPTPLRKLTAGKAKIEIHAGTLQEAIERADAEYPGFRERVLDADGEIKRFINIFVNGSDVRKLQGRATRVQDGDEVAVIPAMAGGEATRTSTVVVDHEWLAQHHDDENLRIVDARVSDPRLPMGYRSGHIPNAVPFDLNRDVFETSDGLRRMKPAGAIAQVLAARGISNDSTVVIYDESTGPLAGYVYWLFKYLGHQDVRVLDGGWEAWKRAGAPISREVPQVQPVTYTAHLDASQRGDADWIQDSAQRQDVLLLDTRSDAEYYMGHIPGAVNLSFDQAIDLSTQTLKDASELRQQFEGVGATPDKEIVTYCASGSRSSHSYMVLKALGFPRVRNYDGSMMDWAQVRGLPVE